MTTAAKLSPAAIYELQNQRILTELVWRNQFPPGRADEKTGLAQNQSKLASRQAGVPVSPAITTNNQKEK